MTYVIGVDAGGSHTEAAVSDVRLSHPTRARGGPGNLTPDSVHTAATAITSTAHQARDSAGYVDAAVAVVVGAAGSGNPSLRDELVSRLVSTGIARIVRVVSDAEIALEGAFPDRAGILLASGTGSIALARDAEGSIHRVGGYGSRIGDEGSGYAIAREGISGALQSLDGRIAPTRLLDDLEGYVRQRHGLDLVRFAQEATVESIADLCPIVLAAADAGDGTAQEVVRRAVKALIAHVAALRQKLPPHNDVPVAFVGGVLGPESGVRLQVERDLPAIVSGTTLSSDPVDPVMGALRLAVRLSAEN